ncbi:IS21 family transposase [Desulfosporosinus nitroreducens]|uniref:IS21 family transposase n=1 Tax=Desulfosporosinus nitroreducens TaxID=2018668 RepID=UPI00207C9AC0|nr:IS21 family transposase [Desulfosporosinus nitroreducens]MCO1604747.1 IS21 family transposase [Desulfosporosinus nitroreducens]
MKGFKMYKQIQQLKEIGFTRSRASKQLNINRETVTRYWNMTADEFAKQLYGINRELLLSKYEEIIISWLKQYPTMTAAQVCDWLKELYREDIKERTVSRYVKGLREKYHLKKSNHPRDYEAVEELPMGQQLQVDFGEKWLQSIDGQRVKIRFAAFVLAHARYKWAFFQSRPFTTNDLVRSCYECFSYIGGMPLELVFDQDSIVSVSENYGDIIHTFEFEKFRQECNLKVYLCRAADPESKGKIENVVKFIKYNFLENRLFADEEILNNSFLAWLDRTGNAKIHSTTKKIPEKVFEDEREHLRPLLDIHSSSDVTIYRNVRKDNTIVYNSNRYSLPLGTYNHQKEVSIEAKSGKLTIMTVFGEFIYEHPISTGRGQLIKSTSHSRDVTDSMDNAQNTVDELLLFKATTFLQTIRTEKARYARDQFRLLQTLCDKYGVDDVLNAISFCEVSKLIGTTYVKDFLEHNAKPKQTIVLNAIPVSNNKYHVTTEKRSLDVYAKAGGSHE